MILTTTDQNAGRRITALADLPARAQGLGAHAAAGIDADCAVVGQSLLPVSVSGRAVVGP